MFSILFIVSVLGLIYYHYRVLRPRRRRAEAEAPDSVRSPAIDPWMGSRDALTKKDPSGYGFEMHDGRRRPSAYDMDTKKEASIPNANTASPNMINMNYDAHTLGLAFSPPHQTPSQNYNSRTPGLALSPPSRIPVQNYENIGIALSPPDPIHAREPHSCYSSIELEATPYSSTPVHTPTRSQLTALHVFELPAVEEVAYELAGSRSPIEMSAPLRGSEGDDGRLTPMPYTLNAGGRLTPGGRHPTAGRTTPNLNGRETPNLKTRWSWVSSRVSTPLGWGKHGERSDSAASRRRADT